MARIALRTLTGSVGIQADRLPVLQRRDRWMVVSGEGGITLVPERAELYAKLQVDSAYIDFSRLGGERTLPSDVVVVRTQQPDKTGAAAAAEVTLDIQGSLGRASIFAAPAWRRGSMARSKSRVGPATCWPRATCARAAAPTPGTGSD